MATNRRNKKTQKARTQTSKALTKSLIFRANKNAKRRVEVPEWGGHVFVRAVRQSEFNELLEAVGEADQPLNEKISRFVILVTCDKNGNRLFSDADHSKVIELGVAGMIRVMRAGMDLNNLDDDDIEEVVGNLPRTLRSSSG